jgi:hypothetical protein
MDKPRKLTREEIEDVLSVIPDIRSASREVSIQNTKSMKVLVKEQLQDIEITPLGISDLKREIVRQYNESTVRPGEMVGVLASDAISKNTTQSALNSFHTSGSSKNVSSGIERVTELLNATNNPKKTSATIYFRDENLAFDDVLIDKRPKITEISVKDLVMGVPDIESYDNIEEPEWYDIYRILIRDDFESKDVLRLNIDTNLLYAYKITMEDVAAVIERDGSVICVYSPMNIGMIDIYPIENQIMNELQSRKISSYENSGLIFLTMVVIPYLDRLQISGIAGIKQIYPVKAPVLQIVKEEMRDDSSFGSGDQNILAWFMILDPVRMRITGITVEKLVNLCKVAGLEVVKVRPNYITVLCATSPLKFLNETINADEKNERDMDKKEREERNIKLKNKIPLKIVKRPETALSKASKLIYADSTGSNLKDLLSDPEIDNTRTYCNDVHEIVAALGIEAGRTFLIREVIDVINAEGYINPRHILLLVDYMSSLGKINGITFSGVSRQPIGALEKASFEQAMEVFREAGGFGEEKSVSGTSASIFIGKKALIGTGFSSEYMRPGNLDRYNKTRKELLEDANMTLDINSFNDAIQEFNVGADIAVLEGDEAAMFGLDVHATPVIRERVVERGIEKRVEKRVEKIEKGKEEMFDEKVVKISEDVSLGKDNLLVKGKVVRSSELEQVGIEMQAEIQASIVCNTSEDIPILKVTSLFPTLPTKTIIKPKPQAVKIFDLDSFMN